MSFKIKIFGLIILDNKKLFGELSQVIFFVAKNIFDFINKKLGRDKNMYWLKIKLLSINLFLFLSFIDNFISKK